MPPPRPTKRIKTIAIPTPERLAEAALRYLGRFAASEASLRRVLHNKMRRASMAHPDFADDMALQATLHQAIESIIARHRRTGVLNDTLFAETKINSLRRQGHSRSAIQQKLLAKGIANATIMQALHHHAADNGEDGESTEADVEYKAAVRMAQRRRLGPFRTAHGVVALDQEDQDVPLRSRGEGDDQSRKDWAAMARAGFSAVIIARVLRNSGDGEA